MSEDTENKKNNLSIFSIFGWILGGLSLLDLLDALSWVNLQQKIKKWLSAYSEFADTIRAFLFDWVPFAWFSIDDKEIHIFILGFILSNSYLRAEASEELEKGSSKVDAYGIALMASLVYLVIVTLPLGLFSGTLGLIMGSIALSFLMLVYFMPDDEEGRGYASRKNIVRELKGVVAVFILLLLVNYTIPV